MADYYRTAAVHWYFIILSGLIINFLAFYSPKSLESYVPIIGPPAAYIGYHYHWITVITNVFALVAHIGESLYATYLCNKLNLSLSCTAQWIFQTFLLGYPSLSILIHANKKKRRA
ncbi:hypothetical protein Q1695_009035 [Nippostrongylus brasiliensis]|nr:hypothetical protein Q1695_009035 [Nippostrongylus brasiliensis]